MWFVQYDRLEVEIQKVERRGNAQNGQKSQNNMILPDSLIGLIDLTKCNRDKYTVTKNSDILSKTQWMGWTFEQGLVYFFAIYCKLFIGS